MCGGVFVLHVTCQGLGAAPCRVHSVAQQRFVPSRGVFDVSELELEVEQTHPFPGVHTT